MAARTDREAARAQMRAVFEKALDRAIPEDQSKPLYGETFQEWEREADRFDQALTPVLMEQRALLADSAEAEPRHLCHCPHCGEAVRLYLQRSTPQQGELQRPHGPAVLGQQSVRGRSCDRSFPPQARDWSLPTGVPLSPHASRRGMRDAITQSSFDKAATAINEDWAMQYERQHMQRFSERAGETLLAQQAQQREADERGRRGTSPARSARRSR